MQRDKEHSRLIALGRTVLLCSLLNVYPFVLPNFVRPTPAFCISDPTGKGLRVLPSLGVVLVSTLSLTTLPVKVGPAAWGSQWITGG